LSRPPEIIKYWGREKNAKGKNTQAYRNKPRREILTSNANRVPLRTEKMLKWEERDQRRRRVYLRIKELFPSIENPGPPRFIEPLKKGRQK